MVPGGFFLLRLSESSDKTTIATKTNRLVRGHFTHPMSEDQSPCPEEESSHVAPEGSIRINKFLASCGYESRRAADRLIAEGRVEVNGHVVETPGVRVLPTDFVKVDGSRALPKEEIVLLLNKPRGFVCSRERQGADGTVYDLIPARHGHVNYVGRLDADSEGLLLLTNNGSLAQKLSHPKSGIEKEYWVTLDQNFDNSVLLQLLKGVRIPEGQAKAKYVSRLSARRACVVLEQGLKRQIRQMFACLGLRVKKLVRVRIGSLWGGDLEPGAIRILTPEEIELAQKNPSRRRHLIGALQAFGPRDQHPVSDTQESADEDAHYEFNPADFEEGDDAMQNGATMFAPGEAFEPERETQRPFGRAQGRDRREGGFQKERRSFGDRREGGFNRERSFGDHKSFGERRSFGDRREGGFNRERSFGERKDFGERRNFGDRREGGFTRERSFGERKDFGERRSFGDRREGGFNRERSFGERKSFGERRNFGDRREGGFNRERSFGERKDFGERRSFGDRREGGFNRERSFGERKDFGERRSFGDRREGGFNRERREGNFDDQRRSFTERRRSLGTGRHFGDRFPRNRESRD